MTEDGAQRSPRAVFGAVGISKGNRTFYEAANLPLFGNSCFTRYLMKMTDAMVCAGLTVFFVQFCPWIPFFGPFLSLLTPLVFLYYSMKLGFLEGAKLAVLSVFVVGLLAGLRGNLLTVFMAGEFSLLGLALSEFFRRGFSIGQTVLSGTILLVLLFLVFILFLSISKNMGPMEMMDQYLQDQLQGSIELYKEMGIPDKRAAEFEGYTKALISMVSKIYPSLMVMAIGFTVWLNVMLARPLFRMKGLEYPGFNELDRWQAPDVLVWVVILSGFSLFLFSGAIKSIAINALIVTMAVYFFHGLSILLFFFNKYRVPGWVRLGVFILILLQQIFLALLTVAGLFDQWIDFRKIKRRAES